MAALCTSARSGVVSPRPGWARTARRSTRSRRWRSLSATSSRARERRYTFRSSSDDVERSLDDIGRQRYQWVLDQTRGFLDEGRRRGVPPAKVADAIEHALTAPRPKARYLVGPDAKLMGHVITRLPDRLRDGFTRIGSRRWEARGRKLRRAS